LDHSKTDDVEPLQGPKRLEKFLRPASPRLGRPCAGREPRVDDVDVDGDVDWPLAQKLAGFSDAGGEIFLKDPRKSPAVSKFLAGSRPDAELKDAVAAHHFSDAPH